MFLWVYNMGVLVMLYPMQRERKCGKVPFTKTIVIFDLERVRTFYLVHIEAMVQENNPSLSERTPNNNRGH